METGHSLCSLCRCAPSVAGSPRVQIPWGPVNYAGEHFVYVTLGGKQVVGCPLRVVLPLSRYSNPRLLMASSTGRMCFRDAVNREPRKSITPTYPVARLSALAHAQPIQGAQKTRHGTPKGGGLLTCHGLNF